MTAAERSCSLLDKRGACAVSGLRRRVLGAHEGRVHDQLACTAQSVRASLAACVSEGVSM
eukprot:4984732-Pleurochrysis_carterae.AAC.4